MRLLLVEDEGKTARQVRAGLEAAAFEVDVARTGEEGLQLALARTPDGMVVDVMLPGFSGLELVRALRDRGAGLPVIFLSARDTTEDRIRGLDAGGDDYLVKPFAFPELLARLRALLRRGPMLESAPARVCIADLEWEPEHRRVSRGGKRIDLTPREYALAELLLEHRGEVVTRAQIVERVWGLAIDDSGNTVDVQVRRLRRKLDDPFDKKLLHTLRGVGHVLEERGA